MDIVIFKDHQTDVYFYANNLTNMFNSACYDNIYRLLNSTNPNEAYTYDPVGNRNPITQTYDSGNRLLEDDTLELKIEGWDINKVAEKVCDLLGVDIKDIKNMSKRSKIAQAKSLTAYFAYKELKVTGVELSKYFG